MLDLYFWPTPNGWKITIALEELGLPYNLIPIDITNGEQFQPAFLKISPNNRMPAIVDPAAPGGPLSVFESGAILIYLGEAHGRFLPAAGPGRYDVLQWLMWQMGGLGPMAGQAFHFQGLAEPIPYAIERYRKETDRLLGVMDRRLADRDFLAGDLSVADFACWGWTVGHRKLGIEVGDKPHFRRWFARMAARPGVQRGYRKGYELRKGGDAAAADAECAETLSWYRAEL